MRFIEGRKLAASFLDLAPAVVIIRGVGAKIHFMNFAYTTQPVLNTGINCMPSVISSTF